MAAQSKYFCAVRTCPSAAEIRLLILNGGRRQRKRNCSRRREREKDQEATHVEDAMASSSEPDSGVEVEVSPDYPDEPSSLSSVDNTKFLRAEMEDLYNRLLQLNVRVQAPHQVVPAADSRTSEEPAGPVAESGPVSVGESVDPAPPAEGVLVGPVAAPPLPGARKLQRLLPWEEATGMEHRMRAPITPTSLPREISAERTVYRWVNPGSNLMGFPGVETQKGEMVQALSWEEYQIQLEQRWQEEEKIHKAKREAYHQKDLAVKDRARKDPTTHQAPRRQGIVTTFKLQGGWGFIKEPGLYAEVFVNRRDVESHLREGHPDRDLYPGDSVTYTRHFGEKGWFALNVYKKEKPAPVAKVPPCDRPVTTLATPTCLAAEPVVRRLITATTVVAKEVPLRVVETPAEPAQRTVGTQTFIAAHDLVVQQTQTHGVYLAAGVDLNPELQGSTCQVAPRGKF